MGKILIITGGGIKHLKPFEENAKVLNLDVTTASFSAINFQTKESKIVPHIKSIPLESFDLIYIRLVGKRYEDLSLLASFAKDKNIKIVDRIYQNSKYARLPLSKSLETKLLIKKNIPLPKTYYASVENIVENAPRIFGFPFVIKGTTGKQGHEVWSPRDKKELHNLAKSILTKEKEGKRFLAQEFIKASQRIRVFVVGGKALAAITRPTRWRKRFTKKPPLREPLMPVPGDIATLAADSCRGLSIDIAGVDIICDDETEKRYVLEVNSAPRWASIAKDTHVNIEGEILKYLASLV
ncbi:RimK family alpha-L-glutamate ligase [Patescibacteria group bacterium]